MDDLREAVVKAAKSDTETIHNNKIMEDSKFSTLDRKTQDWVLKEFTRQRGVSSSSFSFSQKVFIFILFFIF